MALFRAQVVLRAESNLPKDVAVTTFHWTSAAPGAGTPEAIAEACRDFYVSDVAGVNGIPLMNYLSPSLSETAHEVRVYEVDENTGAGLPFPGAPPAHVEVFDFVGRAQPAAPLPDEVAVCLSYRATTPVSVPIARRRGRVYVGPLGTNAMATGGDGVARPEGNFSLVLLAAGEFLKDAVVEADWCVYSRPYAGRDEIVRPGRPTLPALPPRAGEAYVIDQCWRDNSFDTQRRRGRGPTGRTYGVIG